MELKLPEDKLMKIGFRLLDIIYGELTIKKGEYWDEVFVDKNGVRRLGYDKPGSEKQSLLGYLYEDRLDFLRMIPVESIDFKRVMKAWVEERYKRRVYTTDNEKQYLSIRVEERYKRNKKKT